ncbi:hypothetical protein HY570_02915, partial [Candidatus Micrarchaeota archaeon]|nr:hypothetical protein [Candidatus Micrarchaeota archaeon]
MNKHHRNIPKQSPNGDQTSQLQESNHVHEFFTRGLRTAGRAISWPETQAGRQEKLQKSEFEQAVVKWLEEASFRLENLNLSGVEGRFQEQFSALMQVLQRNIRESAVVFNDTNTVFAINVVDGNILFLTGKLVCVRRSGKYDIQLVKDVKKNRQYHILLFPKTETDTLTNDAAFGLIVNLDSYLVSAAKFYTRYSRIRQVLGPLDLRVAEGSITTEEARRL